MWGGEKRDDPKSGCVADCHCPGDMAVRMCQVLARPWVGVCVPLALSLNVLSVDSLFKEFSLNTCNSLSKPSRFSTILD